MNAARRAAAVNAPRALRMRAAPPPPLTISVIRKCFVVQDPRVRNAEHVVVEAGKWLRIEALDLTAPASPILRQITDVAGRSGLAWRTQLAGNSGQGATASLAFTVTSGL